MSQRLVQWRVGAEHPELGMLAARPFLSKNFANTVSPWMLMVEALAPLRKAFARRAGDADPRPYLDPAADRRSGAIDIAQESWRQTARMRAEGQPGEYLSHSN